LFQTGEPEPPTNDTIQKMKPHCLFSIVLTMNTIAWLGQAQPTGTNSGSTNVLANESWSSISNRWGSGSLARVRQAAEGGEVTAQYYLGEAYFEGNGVAKDKSEALKWIKKASDLNYARAQMYLGWLYENGNGVPQDYSAAVKLYRLAAEQGNARAQNNLGHLYSEGLGVPQNVSEAVKWYRQSAEQGDELGQSNLGWMYGHGDGVERDYELAEKWMRLAAEQGTPKLQYYYAEMLTDEFDKSGHQIANFVVAAEWYRKAADQGYVPAQYELAELYNYGKLGDDQRANCIPWYLKAAAQGNAAAQAKVGELSQYYPHSELLKNVDNIGMLRQSAESGNLNAQFQLAQRYQKGDGVPKDLTEAFKWMQKAAHNETPSSRVGDAIYDLALMYEKGEGILQDVSEAHNLFLEAAAGHQSEAMFRVGQMYEKGEGVPQNDHKAVEFYSGKIHNYNNPDKYPNGFVEYGGPGEGAIEKLLNLWTQGRGFPTSQDRAELGYREPGALIKYWEGLIKTAKAQFYAGEIYSQGKVVSKDIAQAADWFNKAAAQGSPEAMNRIGEMWAAGLNGAPDPKEAANWYRKAAAKGSAEAQYALGLCCAKGQGVSTNPVEAWKWLQLAAEQKFPKAAEERDKMQATMTADQLKDARALADQFNVAAKQ
jgi:TPR repeat protein